MPSSMTLQGRLSRWVLIPAVVGVIALAFVSASQFADGNEGLGALTSFGALAVALSAILGARATHQTFTGFKTAIDETAERGRRAAEGEVAPVVDSDIVELASLNQTIDKMAENQRLIKEQTEALAAGDLTDPVLNEPAQGALGEALHQSIEEVRSKEAALADQHLFNASIMDNVSDAVVVVDNDGNIIGSNNVAQVALDLFGGDLESAIPGWRELPSGEHDFTRNLADGTLTLTQISTTRQMTSEGPVTMLCWRDVSGERAMQAQVANVANTDLLTGLPNRNGLLSAHDRLAELGKSASAVHFDLAEFSGINQRHGFDAGDLVLKEVGARLRSVIRDHDTLARVSGDEFVLLLNSHGDIVDGLARRILDRINEPIALPDGTNLRLKAYGGWATGVVDGNYELLRRANYALSEARNSSTGIASYSAEIAQRDEYRRQWESQLRRAIDRNEFVLFAQPIVDVLERRVLGVEIFLRWQHPSGRMISPGEFIGVAEKSDLIIDIDRWVVEQVAREAAHSDPQVIFSLNVSSRFMAGAGMSEFVRGALARNGVPAGRIQVDVTETNVATDATGVIDTIKRLDRMGVKVALDDFGSGYSSLAHLLKLSVSTIKIDRDMVSMVGEPEGRGVIAAILAFAKRRKLTVVAEGVERKVEEQTLIELGCRFQQGYLHGHPAPLAQVLDSLGDLAMRSLEEATPVEASAAAVAAQPFSEAVDPAVPVAEFGVMQDPEARSA